MSKSPEFSPDKAAQRAARTERLARALRENLKRRKERGGALAKSGVDTDRNSATLSDGTVSSKSGDCGAETGDR